MCDGLDNDCDSIVDEMLVRPCGPPDATGICAPGVETCVAGAWSACEGAVEAMPMEICDNERLDENCNGTNNEGCGCIDGETQPCGKDKGICKPGKQTCVGGMWSAQCEGAVDPKKPEVCDEARQDENCDGWQNELCLCIDGQKRACGKDQGICKPGMQTCAGGLWGPCEGAVDPNRPEVCDGARVDENCDGQKNEGCSCDEGQKQDCEPTPGFCNAGRRTCDISGAWSNCTGAVAAPMEVCDAARNDEDCDGLHNEDCACDEGQKQDCEPTPGFCNPGRRICDSRGVWSDCKDSVPAGKEVCDAARNDEDCDTWFNEDCACDEGQEQACERTPAFCDPGRRYCDISGIWSECRDTVPAGEEVCDAARNDEDCDGLHNEDCACSDGDWKMCDAAVGLCNPGTSTCDIKGQWGECEGVDRGTEEVCDGMDSDCDNVVDESATCPNSGDKCMDGVCTCIPAQPCSDLVCGFDSCGKLCENKCTKTMINGVCYSDVCNDQFNECATEACPETNEPCEPQDPNCAPPP